MFLVLGAVTPSQMPPVMLSSLAAWEQTFPVMSVSTCHLPRPSRGPQWVCLAGWLNDWGASFARLLRSLVNGPILQLILPRKEAGASGLLEAPELAPCCLHLKGDLESSRGPQKV